MVDELHDRGIRVLLWQIPLAEGCACAGQASAHDRATMRRARLLRAATPTGTPVPQPRLVVPARAAARLHERRGARVVDREAPLPHRGARHRRLQDRRRRARLGPRSALRRRHARRRDEQPLSRCSTRPRTTSCSRLGRHGRRDVQPCRLHRLAGVPCHWAGDEDSTWEAFRASITAGLTAGASRHLLLGLGPRRLLRRAADAELYLRSTARRLLRADHAVPLGVQPSPHAVARPHAVERRRAARATRAYCDVFRRFAQSARAARRRISREQARALGLDREAADARALLRGGGRRADLGLPARVLPR